MRSQGAMEGRRHGRGWCEVEHAGGCGARARRHVPTSRGCRRGAGGEGWESHRVGPLRELFHVRLASGCDSSAGGNADALRCVLVGLDIKRSNITPDPGVHRRQLPYAQGRTCAKPA